MLHTFYLPTAAHRGKHRPMATKGGNNILYLFMVAVQHWETSLRHCTDNEKQGLLNSRATPLFKHLQRVFFSFSQAQPSFSLASHLDLWVTSDFRDWQFLPSPFSEEQLPQHRQAHNTANPLTDVCTISGIARCENLHSYNAGR